ncbi:hypothetical protein G6011_10166 [Alternaria panax]|uniref:Uncharacterized protein n=1 Tax=Alternaria panax TaxID=48097 RepID=A0AAD4FBT2_9PLEO|nr:hypothetical protein G6011_10166 [Alternaria panax]
MLKFLVAILAITSTGFAWHGRPGMVDVASTTDATNLLPSSTVSTPTSTGGATTTAHRLVTRITTAHSAGPSTLATVARSYKDHEEKRDDTHIYSNAQYTWMSEYDGRLVTVKPCVPATT